MILNIREANINDAQLLFSWANDPVTRQSSFNSDPIEWKSHLSWMENSIKNVNRILYIVLFEEIPVGTVRFDQNDTTVIGVTVAPEFRGKGMGAKIIKIACEAYLKKVNTRKIVAYIKNENLASVKAFQKAGFSLTGEGLWNNIPCIILILESYEQK